MVARYDPMKDHATLLQALHLLLHDQTNATINVHLVLIGKGMTPDNAALMHLVRSYGLEQYVHLLGERRDVAQLTPGFDIATLSSAFGEGFPNVIGEAMACGVSCVVTNVGDSAGVVGETGIVVHPRNAAALARGWRTLIALGPQGRQRMGQAARRRIEEQFDLSVIVQRYEALYGELAGC
jgi:glycosyltransferase involved in cell wall biosynthesis